MEWNGTPIDVPTLLGDRRGQTYGRYLTGQLAPHVVANEVYLTLDLVLEDSGFEVPIIARSDPYEFVTVRFPARNSGKNFLDADGAGKVLRQFQAFQI